MKDLDSVSIEQLGGDVFLNVSRTIFTGDVLRVEDHRQNRFENPQTINVTWLRRLLAPAFENALSVPSVDVSLTETSHPVTRLDIYQMHGIPFSTAGWASVYRSRLCERAEQALIDVFDRGVVVSFELPPYLKDIFDRNCIPYIDFTIYPLRFLQDCVLGARTNVAALRQSMEEHAVPEDVFQTEARLLSARASRRMQGSAAIPPGSAVFLGQTEFDASLVSNGIHAGQIDVELALREMVEDFGTVFYKRHPHSKPNSKLDSFLDGEPRINVLERNIYDLLGSGFVSVAGSLSSSVLWEAPYFGVTPKRFLNNGDHFACIGAERSWRQYIPLLPYAITERFWRSIIHGDSFKPSPWDPNFLSGSLKHSLNMTWGR
ncbi:hypothetical protein H0I76_07385 [Limibaculum sp. M0105]|uniref:Uncharacterized protein n=1 Tax=Thermohalobaculum xanthum TaxID=2753746 RepID=A0A8J7M710_9RHOB|nr:hypothetical protein [Thermohalobaculum xanthum]MBK0399007.1 hypothetical protein [Thermohalobaculum xanthum]